jgi:hypothetical protein
MGPGMRHTQHFEDVPHVLWLNVPLEPLKTAVLGSKSPQTKIGTKICDKNGACGKFWHSIYINYLIGHHYSDGLLAPDPNLWK